MSETALKVEEVEFAYSQEADCCDDSTERQVLRVKTQDGGGGAYLILNTERWAIDDVAKFAALLRDVLQRVDAVADAGERGR